MINMKKTISVILVILMILNLAACDSKNPEKGAEDTGFKPLLDTSVKCNIKVAGGYDNFEALEAEFDRFNKYYPNAELVYTKVDDYNNMIGTVLNGNDAPDIYLIILGCMEGTSISLQSNMPRIWPIRSWDLI